MIQHILLLIILFNLIEVQANSISPIDSFNLILSGNYSDKEKVEAHHQLAKLYSKESSPEMFRHAYLGKKLAKKIKYPLGIGKINYFLAEANQGLLKNDSLIQLLKEAELCFEEAEAYKEEAQALNKMGILYERQGKYRASLKCYYEALFIFQSLNDNKGIANERNNIGLIHQLQKRNAMAINFFQQSVEIGLKLKDDDILANAYNNMAIIYQEENKKEMARRYFNLVLEIDKKSNIPHNLAYSYNNLGVVETDLGNFNTAKDLFFQAIQIKRNLDENAGLANIYNNLATLYLKNKRNDSAAYYLNLAIPIAEDELEYPILSDSYLMLSEMMENAGDYSGALRYRKLGDHLKDSLSVVENENIFEQFESDFQSLEKEKTALEISADQEKTAYKAGIVIWTFLLISVLITVMVYYLIKGKKTNEKLQTKQNEIEEQNQILQLRNIEVIQAKETAEIAANIKSQFISTISHEIRTPLNAIIGVANLLREGLEPSQGENLRILKISSENLLQLVNNILDFSKLEAGKMQMENIAFNLQELVMNVRDLIGMKASEKGIQLLIEYDEKIPRLIKGDPLRINQLLINLVNNAIKFTETGYVKIVISYLPSIPKQAHIQFEIIDSGIGIPKAIQAEIFNSFTQADSNTTRKFGGKGLGLSICKRILENLNSQLYLESKVGSGSRFFFDVNFEMVLPGEVQNLLTSEVFEDTLKGRKVLVVEDNQMNILVIQQFLQKWGVLSEVAHNGREGFNKVMETDFDVVLMDIHMPEMDGIEVTRLIRSLENEKKRNVPIIALTAENEAKFRQKVYDVGMNDFIFKPFKPEDLRERLGQVIHRKGSQTPFRRES